MTSPLDQSLSKLNINPVEDDHKIRLKYIKNQFQQGKTVFKGYQTFCKKYGDDEMKYKDFDFWYYRFKNGLNDLDYDRSKDPETHEFSEFPMEIVKKIVEKLEWKDKLNLRDVSRGLREAVDNSKQYFSEIELRVVENCVSLKIDSEYWMFRDKKKWREELTYLGTILKWPKMKTESLWIEYQKSLNEQEMGELVNETNKIFSSLNHQISTERLSLAVRDVDTVHAILPKLKPGFLNDISIFHDEWMNYNEIIQLDQWKQAKRATVEKAICPIESILHFDSFWIELQSMTIEEFLKMKNTLCASPTFERCHIQFDKSFDMGPLLSAVDAQGIPITETSQSFEILVDSVHKEFSFLNNSRWMWATCGY